MIDRTQPAQPSDAPGDAPSAAPGVPSAAPGDVPSGAPGHAPAPRQRDPTLTLRQQRWCELLEEAAGTGVVTLELARRHHVSERAVRDRARRERWTKLQAGAWALPGREVTHRMRCHAAQWVAGERGLVARRSAAYLQGLIAEPPATVEMVVAPDRDPVRRPGITSWQSATLLASDGCIDAQQLRMTTPLRTAGDLGAVLRHRELLYAAIAGRQRDDYTVADLDALLGRLGTAPGTALLREVVAEMGSLDSGFEHTVRAGFAAAGVPAPHPDPYRLRCADGRDIHLDIAWPPQKLAVEVMGLSAHGVGTQRTDQIRHNQATVADWTILYVGWERWRDERGSVIAEVRSALARRGL